MSPEYIDTTEPLTAEDPSLAWLRREHPEVIAARETPHEFTAADVDPRTGLVTCRACWQRESKRVHLAAR